MKPTRRNPLFARFFRGNTLTTAVVVSLAGLALQPSAQAADIYYKSTTAANTWTGAFWGTASGGPYDQAWVSSSVAIFEDNGGTGLAITGATTDFSAITANESVTVTAGGTLGTGGTVATITVASGKTFNFQGQALSSALGTGFIKAGLGTLSLTGATYPGGLTLSEGTVAAGGVNALGVGGPLAIAGGITLRSTSATARNFTDKPSSISINGDFTLGDATNSGLLTFNAPTALGSATRTLTLASAATFNGAIGGDAGVGLTKLGAGTLTLGGANTYDGITTVSAGIALFQKRVALYNADASKWNATNLVVDGTGSLAFGVGGTGEFTSAEIATLSGLTPALGLSTASASATISDVITGGPFTKLGANTLTLSGANTYTGGTTIAAGTLRVSNIGNNTATPSSLGTTGGINFTGNNTLEYSGIGETTDRLVTFATSNGGNIAQNGTGTLIFSSPMTGAAIAMGVTLTGAGIAEMNGIANTAALLNFNKSGVGKWTVNGSITPNGGNIRPQLGVFAFSGTSSTTGDAIVTQAARFQGGTFGGVITFATGSSIKSASTNTNGMIGGWATYNGIDWAKTNGAGAAIDGLAIYTDDTWSAGTNTNVTVAGANPGADATTHSLRFNEAGAKTLTLSGINKITSGGVLVTPTVDANATTVSGGTLAIANFTKSGGTTGAFAGDLILHQNNAGGALSIGSIIANTIPAARTANFLITQKVITGLSSTTDLVVGMSVTGTGIATSSTIASVDSATQITLNNNTSAAGSGVSLTFGAAANGITKAGPGAVTLTGANTYTGATYVLEGTLDVTAKAGSGVPYAVARGATLKCGYAGPDASGSGDAITLNGNGVSDPAGLYFLVGKQSVIDKIDILGAPTTIRSYGGAGTAYLKPDLYSSPISTDVAASGSVIDSTVNIRFTNFTYGGLKFQPVAGANTATGDLVVNGPITGNSNGGFPNNTLYQKGAGSLKLTAVNTFSLNGVTSVNIENGSVILAGGDDRLPATTAITLGTGATSGKLILGDSGTTLSQTLQSLATSGTGTTNAVVGGNSSNSTLVMSIATDGTLAVKLGGTGTSENNIALAKSGAGVLTLANTANSYTGGTTVNGGTLRINDATGTVASTGTLTVNSGGTLDGTGTVSVPVTVSATGGSVTGGAAGTGNLNLSSLTFDGVGAVNVIPGTTRIAVAGTLTASGASESVTVNIGLNPIAAGTHTLVSHSGGIAGTGLSAFILGTTPGGPFTYTLNDAGGILSLDVETSAIFWKGNLGTAWTTANNWHVAEAPVTFASGGAVVLDDSATDVAPVVDITGADVSPGSVQFSNITKAYTLQGTHGITGAAGLSKSGAGVVTITNPNSFTGEVAIVSGTIEAGTIANGGLPCALGSGTNIALNGGKLNHIGAAAATDRTVTLGATGLIDVENSLTLSGAITGGFGLTKSGPGSLVLIGDSNGYSGAVTVSNGTLTVGDGTTIGVLGGSGTISVASPATLTYKRSDSVNIGRAVIGTGKLVQDGTGTLRAGVAGINVDITVNSGTFQVSEGGWATTYFTTANRNVTVDGAGSLLLTTVTHPLGGLGGTFNRPNIYLTNGGTWQLNAEQYMAAGDIFLTAGHIVQTGNNLRLDGGTMSIVAAANPSTISRTGTGDIMLFASIGFQVADGDAAVDFEISAPINENGTRGLTKTGDGKMVLAGVNTYTGTTTVNAGVLELADNARLAFAIPASGTSNQVAVTGTGSVAFDGDFYVNTTAADALTTGSWTLAPAASGTASYSGNFQVVNADGSPWVPAGSTWTKSGAGGRTWTFDTATGLLTLSLSGYGSWAALNAPGETAEKDYDKDGVPNGVEYVLGGSKDTNDLDKLPKPGIDGDYVTFTFNRAQASKTADTTVAVEVGTTLASWPDVYAVPAGPVTAVPGLSVSDLGGGWDKVELKVLRAPDATKFAHLKVTVQ